MRAAPAHIRRGVAVGLLDRWIVARRPIPGAIRGAFGVVLGQHPVQAKQGVLSDHGMEPYLIAPVIQGPVVQLWWLAHGGVRIGRAAGESLTQGGGKAPIGLQYAVTNRLARASRAALLPPSYITTGDTTVLVGKRKLAAC